MIRELLLYFALLLWFVVPSQAQPTIFASDITVDANGIAEVDVLARNFEAISGLQFAIDWDESVLAFETVHNFSLPAAGSGNFNLYETSGRLRIQWWSDAYQVPDNQVLFTVRFQVVGQAQDISPITFTDDVNVGGTLYTIEFLDGSGQLIDVTLENGSVTIAGMISTSNLAASPVVDLYNAPNPFSQSTQIIFELKDTENLQFSVYDILGKPVFRQAERKYSEGKHFITVNNEKLPSSGIYMYELRGLNSTILRTFLFQK